MNKKIILNILRVSVSVGLIGFLFWKMRGNLGQAFQNILSADWAILALATLINILNSCFMGYRLKKIMAVQNIDLSLKETSSLTFIGYFFNNFLPTSIGGDVAKAYYAVQKSKKPTESYTSIFLDRAIGMSTMGLIAFVPLFFLKQYNIDKIAYLAVSLLIGGSIFIFLVVWNRTIALKLRFLSKFANLIGMHSHAKKAYDCLHGYIKHKKVLLNVFVCSFLMQIIFITVIYLLAKSIGVNVPILNFFLIVPITGAVSMLPSLGGLGLRESAFVYFFKDMMTPDKAFAVSMLWLFQLFVLSLIGGLLQLFKFHVKVEDKELEGI